MPELPEVETIVRGLGPHVVGRRVLAVRVHERRLRVPLARAFTGALAGRRIVALARRGKTVVAALDDGRCWLVHLGMTGRLALAEPATPPRPHDHVEILLEGDRRLVYNDVRRFGRLAVVPPDAVAAAVGAGLEPLDPAFDAAALQARARGRRVAVKALLMDQRAVVGIGNIYASEILHRAGVRPRRRVARVGREEWARIVDAARDVLHAAIACGGSTISDYRDGFEGFGSYQRHHAVYGRDGAPCRRCGATIRSVVVTGRSSFYCPVCQR